MILREWPGKTAYWLAAITTKVVSRFCTPPRDCPNDLRPPITTRNQTLLAQALSYAERAYDQEEQRQDTIESKATTLLTGLGITATLLAAAGGLFLSQSWESATSAWLVMSLASAYLAAILFLGGSFWFALNAVRVNWSNRPDPRTFLDFQHSSPIDLQHEQIQDLLVSYCKNFNVNNERAADLKMGYLFLRLAGVSLLVASGLIAGYGLWVGFARL